MDYKAAGKAQCQIFVMVGIETIIMLDDFPVRGSKLNQREVETMGDACVESFAAYLGIELTIFKKHLVDDGSYIGHCFGEYVACGKVVLAVEAIVLLGLRRRGTPSAICAELLHFLHGRRVGFQEYGGLSYVNYLYDRERGWIENGDEMDSAEEWASIKSPRFTPGQPLSITYDGWKSSS